MKRFFTLFFALVAGAGSAHAQDTEPARGQVVYSNQTNDSSLYYSGFRINIEGGYALRLGALDGLVPSEDAFNFRSGFVAGMNISGIFKNGKSALGLAVDYRGHSYKPGYNSIAGDKYRVTTIFIGPVFTETIGNRSFRESHAYWDVALGYMNFGEKFRDEKLNSSSFGAKLGIGYAIGNQKRGAFTIKLSMLAGTISQRNIETGENERGNISSFNLTVGVAFGN